MVLFFESLPFSIVAIVAKTFNDGRNRRRFRRAPLAPSSDACRCGGNPATDVTAGAEAHLPQDKRMPTAFPRRSV
eukprot:scaffold1166_cov261-Pinguiococcus_pyrenoidosus.AAC.34